MTIENNQVNMTATAALIISGPLAGGLLNIVNTGSNVVYLGDANVTSANGLALIANWLHSIRIGPGEAVYGICASGQTSKIGYMLTELPQA